MYPKITQPLTKTVVRTKSPIKTPQPELLSKTLETSNSRNKLHSPTPTKTQGHTTSSKPKSPQQVLKIWYSQHNSVVAGAKGLGGSRTQTTPSKTSITERDSSLDYRSLSAKSPNKNSSQGFQTVGRYNSTEEQENVNSVSQYARKEGSYASSTRDREYNSSHKSSRMSDGDNENLRKHLNGEMRVNLGSYVLQKVMGRIWKKEAMNRLVEYFIHLRLLHQGKLLRLSPVQPEPSERKMQSLTERKDKKKADEYFEYQEEETETESVSYASSREGNLFDGSYMESVDKRQYMGSLKEPSNQKMYRGPSNSIIPENVSRDRANRTAEDWAEMFIRKVDFDTRREKGMSKQELENERELQQKRERMRIAVRAAVLIQRRFRYYIERKRRMQEMVKRKKMASHRSAKIERENVVMSSERSVVERKNLSESSLGVVEQLTSELGLAKKKMTYLQKENENLLNNIKNLESNMEKRVNEKLTIERARIKDTLNEYSVFIDKLLEEKKQLEQKNEAQAKLITELCARLENKDTVEENAKSLLLEENKELIQPSQYFSIVQEKEALKTKLSMLGSKMPTLETKEEHSTVPLNKSYSQPKEEFSMSSNIMKSSSQSSLLSESHKYPEGKRKVMHKGSFGRVDEDCFQVVLEQNTIPKLTTNTYFSTQGNETSRKNSQQSQAESAKFQYNSHSHETSSYFPNNMNKSSTEFMYLSEELMSDRDRYRQATPTKARKNRAEMKSEEKKPRSAREAHEFSFEAKTQRNNESEFTEPFILSVALQGKSPRRNNDLRKSVQEVENQHSQSMLVNSESRRMLVDRDVKSSRERLQSARNEKRVSREKEEVELPEIDNLIANLSTRLYIEEGDKGKVRKDSRENQNNREYLEKGNIYEKKLDEDEIPSMSRGSSTDLQSERSEEIVNKSESVFQRLSRSVPKSFV